MHLGGVSVDDAHSQLNPALHPVKYEQDGYETGTHLTDNPSGDAVGEFLVFDWVLKLCGW